MGSSPTKAQQVQVCSATSPLTRSPQRRPLRLDQLFWTKPLAQEHLERIFAAYDRDRDLKLSRAEARLLLRDLLIASRRLLMERIDQLREEIKTNLISQDNQWIVSESVGPSAESYYADLTAKAEKAYGVLFSRLDEHIEAMMLELDANGDGTVCHEDFCKRFAYVADRVEPDAMLILCGKIGA